MKKLAIVAAAILAVVGAALLSGCIHSDAGSGDGNFYARCSSEACYLAGGWHTGAGKSKGKQTPVKKTCVLIGFPLWMDADEPKVNGLAFSPVLLWGQDVNGVVIAPFNLTSGLNGVSVGPLIAASSSLNGLSFAVLNMAGDGKSGQLGLFNSRGEMGRASSYDERGIFQVGIYNSEAGRGVDVQCGFFNQCDDMPYFQFGLVNFADKTPGRDKKEKSKHFYLQIGLCNCDGGRGLPFMNLGW